MPNTEPWREKLRRGVVIPAHPLAIDANRKLDERRQRALTRYYLAAGAGGVAVGVHTTQFEIRDGKAVVPGGARSEAAWAELTGVSPEQGAASPGRRLRRSSV